MLAPNKTTSVLRKTHAAPGEPFVWLTSMGLGIGLLMVVGLLAIIIVNGVPVFWPSRVYEAKLKEGVTNPVRGTRTIVGEIAQKRTKSIDVLDKDGKPVGDQTEMQFFVGNKDAYGFSFVFVDSDDIASITSPRTSWPSNASNTATPSVPGLAQARGRLLDRLRFARLHRQPRRTRQGIQRAPRQHREDREGGHRPHQRADE